MEHVPPRHLLTVLAEEECNHGELVHCAPTRVGARGIAGAQQRKNFASDQARARVDPRQCVEEKVALLRSLWTMSFVEPLPSFEADAVKDLI